MPSSVCLRRGLVVAGVANALAGDGAGAGLDVRATGGADETGRGAAGTGVGRRGAGSGVARRGAVGSGVAARGAGSGVARGDAGSGVAARGGAGSGVARDGVGAGGLATGDADVRGAASLGARIADAWTLESSCGRRAGAGRSSSAPHSESMSSVGGAMEGRGALALTRSLSDRLSVIALHPAFHGLARKSSTQQRYAGQTCKIAAPGA
jgi:hypothetical protein